MTTKLFDPEKQRKMLELSFEPEGEGFVFYRNRWSAGVPVTAEEREEYLSIPILSSRHPFYEKIAGRTPSSLQRDWSKVRRNMLRVYPVRLALASLLVSLIFLGMGLDATNSVVRYSFLILAVAMVVFCVQIIAAKLQKSSL